MVSLHWRVISQAPLREKTRLLALGRGAAGAPQPSDLTSCHQPPSDNYWPFCHITQD